MPRWKWCWLWGGIVLAGAICQAQERLGPEPRWAPREGQQGSSVSGQEKNPSDVLPAWVSPRSSSPLYTATSRSVPNDPVQKQPTAAPPTGGLPDSQNTPEGVWSKDGQAGGSGEAETESISRGTGGGRPGPLRLRAPGESPAGSNAPGRAFDPTASTLTVLSSLAVVLGVFLLLVWAIRRAMPRRSQLLPKEVVEVLGRSPLMGRQQMYLLRCGPKLLLVSVSPEGAETLTEIDHPDEVARIIALCRQGQPGSIPGAFRHVLDQMARSKSHTGWFRRSESALDFSDLPKESHQEAAGHV